jgi:nitrate/TMAO reductase-like tetraheme cytochrome c subunit
LLVYYLHMPSPPHRSAGRSMKKTVVMIFCGIIIGLILSLTTAEMIDRTSDVTFCSSCHSMQDASRSFAEDVHGGMNSSGFKAKCVDCHLPHDSVVHFITAKAYTATKDLVGEIFRKKPIVRTANLKSKDSFTYTSGCLQCHDLGAIHYKAPQTISAHKDFISGKATSCLTCHENVGHKHIKNFLVKQK